MNNDLLKEITAALETNGRAVSTQAAGIGSKANRPVVGMFGRSASIGAGARALMSACGETSSRIASIASRGLEKPESLTLEEIKSVCASALTQTANKG